MVGTLLDPVQQIEISATAFGDDGAYSHAQNLACDLARNFRREKDDRSLTTKAQDAAGRFHPVEIGHVVVENDYVGTELTSQRNRRAALSSLAANFPGWIFLNNFPKCFSDIGVVIHQQNSFSAHTPLADLGSRRLPFSA